MAENDSNQNAQAGQNQQGQGPQFALQRIYLKDLSFESPRSPDVFRGEWSPRISFNLATRNQRLSEGVYEVVLTLTVEAKQQDGQQQQQEQGNGDQQEEGSTAFLIEVQQAGVFTCSGFGEQDLERVLATVCPNILFPYAREAIDSLVVRGSFPPVMLSPVNFDAVYEQSKQQQQEQGQTQASGEIQTGGSGSQ